MKLLSVNHLSKRYPGFALQQVSFSVYPGRIMGLIGKNGAGKSTTLKSILNMVHPDSGDVKMFGMDFYQHEKECKQQIGVVFGGVDFFYPLKKLSSITAVTRRFIAPGIRKNTSTILSFSIWTMKKNLKSFPMA